MRVMVIVKATKESEAGELPSTELLTAMGNYNEELVAAGIMLSGEGLQPSARGARVRFSGASRMVIDGPFAETNEVIAGFWLWKVRSMEEAIEWVKRCPNPMTVDSDIEIRPVFEADDLGEAFTPELREQEAVLRAKSLGLGAPSFQTSPELLVAGLNESYTAATRTGIPMQWQRLSPHLDKLAGRIGNDAYGVCWNADTDCNFEYLTGVTVSSSEELPPEFKTITLDARRHIVFAHTGHVSAFPTTIDTIWTKWAPDCGLRLSKDAPCFERYSAEFDIHNGVGGMEIWIPLEV